jgi:hypothetical protein
LRTQNLEAWKESLQQFLTVPEKYNLKYVLSNDKFYDPILYFCGWHRLTLLENGIMVWEKLNIPPLSKILPAEDVPVYQSGIIPLLTVVAFVLNIQMILYQALKLKTTVSQFSILMFRTLPFQETNHNFTYLVSRCYYRFRL